jgi:hypothetical protein
VLLPAALAVLDTCTIAAAEHLPAASSILQHASSGATPRVSLHTPFGAYTSNQFPG